MSQFQTVIRMGTGGATLGVLLGVFLGGVAGTAYGFWVDNLEFGLDGALIGAGTLGILGTCYGSAISRHEFQHFTDAVLSDESTHSIAVR
ncbi:MAG: hypothetical protein LC104_19140 [Bacteroidales bacterium]|nr:hypothetical protein [Bacteroidales bacterium]